VLETARPRAAHGPLFGAGARRLHFRVVRTPLEHQIIDRSEIRPLFNSLDES
jgi:hypothetical protein